MANPALIMEDVQREQSSEQPGAVQTVDPREVMGGQKPQLPDNRELQQQQEEDHFKNALELSDLPEEIDGKPIHKGQNPCRKCYQTGRSCNKAHGSDTCTTCSGLGRICHQSLAGAKPYGRWEKVAVLDYSAPISIKASRIILYAEEKLLEYEVKYAYKPRAGNWESAEAAILKAYPWVLKKFHHDNPDIPPPEWLVKYEDDDFFYGKSNHLPM